MADATFEILETRAVIGSDFTRLYVLCGPDSEGGTLVGGWYTTVVGKDVPALDALRDALASGDYLTKWDRGAPPS